MSSTSTVRSNVILSYVQSSTILKDLNAGNISTFMFTVLKTKVKVKFSTMSTISERASPFVALEISAYKDENKYGVFSEIY